MAVSLLLKFFVCFASPLAGCMRYALPIAIALPFIAYIATANMTICARDEPRQSVETTGLWRDAKVKGYRVYE